MKLESFVTEPDMHGIEKGWSLNLMIQKVITI